MKIMMPRGITELERVKSAMFEVLFSVEEVKKYD
jgi:hypothetical protein